MISERNPRAYRFRIATLVISLAAGALFCEGLLRALGMGYGSAPLISDPVLEHAHPRDYCFTVFDPAGEFGGHRICYDHQGFVVDPDRPATTSNFPAAKRVAFMGDSYLEAVQVPFSSSFFGILQKVARPDVEMKNFGCSSYSPILYDLQWDKEVAPFHPTHVFLLLNSNDVDDDRRYGLQAVYDAERKLVAVPGHRPDWLVGPLRRAHLVRFLRKVQLQCAWLLKHPPRERANAAGNYLEEDPDFCGATPHYLLELAEKIRRSQTQLELLVVPSKYRLQGGRAVFAGPEFSDRCGLWAKQNGIAFIGLAGPFWHAAADGSRLFFDRDVHFNPRGHAVAAATLRAAFPELFQR